MVTNRIEIIKRIYIGILLFIFGGIVLHAPISMALGSIWPDYSLIIKSWKEILMLVAGFIAIFLLFKNKKVNIFKDPVIIAIFAYAILHILMLFYKFQGIKAATAGLAIDLRYVLFFSLVYIAMKLYPEYRRLFIKVGIIGAFIVLVFALLQVFILPHDILKYIGYNINTISPYLTVDQNHAFIRINSTLRGPNPLGAYAVIALSLIAAYLVKRKLPKGKLPIFIISIMGIGGLVALWVSYSRSALIAAIFAVVVVLAVTTFRKLSTNMWIVISFMVFVLSVGLFAFKDSSFVSNVLLHENPTNIDNISSNAGHINSLSDGLNQLVRQPLGAGVGSTGSASILVNRPEIIENQYLFIAHEVGWLGLALFLYIFGLIMYRLWKLRDDWLALGVFAGGIGIALICVLLPMWVDDTVSIIWWGLATIALFPNKKGYN